MAVPEFSGGGLDALAFGRADGHRLAWIRPDEFVMRPEATRYWGAPALDAMNRAPAYPTGGPVSRPTIPSRSTVRFGDIHVTMDGRMSRREAERVVLRALRDATAHGAI